MRNPRIRSISLVGALVALVAFAPTASAATMVTSTGTTGVSSISEPAGRCTYNSSYLLTSMKALKPTVYGKYATNSWVGWRMRVLYLSDFGSDYETIWQSPVQKDKAKQSVAADGFTPITWTAPGDPDDTGRYRFQVVVLFYKQGSKSVVEGRTVWQPQHLNVKYGSKKVQSLPYDFCVVEE